MRYKSSRSVEKWEIVPHVRKFAMVPDRSAGVLEFRLFVAANLSGAVDRQAQFDPEDLTLGQLRGVVDGDGYNRPVLIVSYSELQQYATRMLEQVSPSPQVSNAPQVNNASEALTHSDPHPSALSVRAMTDGHTGRFRGLSLDYRLSVAALTTTVTKVL